MTAFTFVFFYVMSFFSFYNEFGYAGLEVLLYWNDFLHECCRRGLTFLFLISYVFFMYLFFSSSFKQRVIRMVLTVLVFVCVYCHTVSDVIVVD